jgi:hypothetical protein
MKLVKLSRVFVLAGVLTAAAVSQAQAAGPYQFFSVTPCRVADTRNAVGPSGGPALTSGAVRSFPVAGICGIPSTAKAAALNVTLVGPTQDGFITIWPFNTTMPGVSTINAAAGEPAIANGAIVPLTADPNFHISAVYGTSAAGTANLVLDVTGYFQ